MNVCAHVYCMCVTQASVTQYTPIKGVSSTVYIKLSLRTSQWNAIVKISYTQGKNYVQHRVMATHHAWILTGSSFELFVFFRWVVTMVTIKLQWATDIIIHLSESIRD